ncbi:MAG: enolase C-terminal domain-like protein [Pseudomonadota bacterium]
MDSRVGRLVDFDLREVRISEKTIWRFVVLHDDMGNSGHGEFSYDSAPENILVQASKFISSILDRPATGDSLAAIGADLNFMDLVQATLYSAVEQALLELEAKSAQVPLWKYLGGRNGKIEIPMYANINRRTVDRSPEGFAKSAAKAVASGFSWIKIAPFDGVSADTDNRDRIVFDGLDRINAVRAEIGNRSLMIDCHWRFSPQNLLDLLSEFSKSQICWLECPVAETLDNLSDAVAIRNSANSYGMRVAGLETHAMWEHFQPFIEANAYDVVMPDIKHCGGYRAFLEIARNAAEHGVGVSAHNPTGPIAHLASLHVTAAIGAPEPMEVQFDESPRFFDLTEPVQSSLAPTSRLPSGAGLGARLAGQKLSS